MEVTCICMCAHYVDENERFSHFRQTVGILCEQLSVKFAAWMSKKASPRGDVCTACPENTASISRLDKCTQKLRARQHSSHLEST